MMRTGTFLATSMVLAKLCFVSASAPKHPQPMRRSLEVTSSGDVIDKSIETKAPHSYDYESEYGYYSYDYNYYGLGADDEATAAPPTPRTTDPHGPGVDGSAADDGSSTGQDINTIICPFFATMINEGALPKQQTYSRKQLMEFSIKAGLSPDFAAIHVGSNFRNVRTNMTDLFAMEGFPNEHFTSTGINDCATDFPTNGLGKCEFNQVVGDFVCPTPEPDCRPPEKRLKNFATFWDAMDTDKDGFMTQGELDEVEKLYDPGCKGDKCIKSVDINPGAHLLRPVSGDIKGSFGLIIQVFGDNCTHMKKERLQWVTVLNKFPTGFSETFPPAKTPRCPNLKVGFDRTCLDTLLSQIGTEDNSNAFRTHAIQQVTEDLELLVTDLV